jgi:hypothetical protein
MVMKEMHFAGSAVNIAIIDAGRSNPLAPSYRGPTPGWPRLVMRIPMCSSATPQCRERRRWTGRDRTALCLGPGFGDADSGVDIHASSRRCAGRVPSHRPRQVTWDASTLMQPFFFLPPPS